MREVREQENEKRSCSYVNQESQEEQKQQTNRKQNPLFNLIVVVIHKHHKLGLTICLEFTNILKITLK